MKNTLKFLVLISFVFLSATSFSQKNTSTYRKKSDEIFQKLNAENCKLLECIPLMENNNILAYVYNYINGGFVIVDIRIDAPIIGFSDKGRFETKNNPFLQYLIEGIKLHKTDFDLPLDIEKAGVKELKTDVLIDPLLTDVWGGVNCIDETGQNINATNLYTPQNCSAGCVAISASQIFNYYKWPKKAMGNHVYKDSYDGISYTHSAFFDGAEYDWTNIKDEYYGVASTVEERQAVSELIYNTAVAVQMDFGPTGSSSHINKIPFILGNFFRYCGHYEEASWSSFWNRMYENVTNEIPVQIGLKASATGVQHAAVIDGYKEMSNVPYYHMNWGWYNNKGINGYYNVQGWTSSSGGYNTITDAIFDFLPTPEITDVTSDGDQNITIQWEVSDNVNWDAFELEMKKDDGSWGTVSSTITSNSYSIASESTVTIYQFRVRTKISNSFYLNSWSNEFAYANEGYLDGYISLGGSQYAYARQTPNNDLNFSGEYTFEFWINVKDGNQNNDVILYQQDAFTLGIDNITSTSYAIEFIAHNSNAYIKSYHSDLLLNEWVHVAVSHSGNKTKLFVNGEKDVEHSGSDFNLSTSSKALNLGEKYISSYSNFIVAEIDQLRISKVDRHSDSFIPLRGNVHQVDDNTVAQLDFNQPHKVRLKDEAFTLSFIVKNESGGVIWKGSVIENSFVPVITPNQLAGVMPDSPNGTVVCTVLATDEDVFATVFQDWTITGGNTNNVFAIDKATGEITVHDFGAMVSSPLTVYNLQLTVSDGQNTSAIENLEITVDQTTSSDNHSFVDGKLFSVNVYPNPTTDFVEIQVGNNQQLKTIEVYDLSGTLKKKMKSNSRISKLDLSDLPSGIYLLNIQYEEEHFIRKIIKI